MVNTNFKSGFEKVALISTEDAMATGLGGMLGYQLVGKEVKDNIRKASKGVGTIAAAAALPLIVKNLMPLFSLDKSAEFKTGFEKTAFVGALARGAGKLTGMARKSMKATSAAGTNLSAKAKQHVGGLKEHVKRNFKAGLEGTKGTKYKDSLRISKMKATNAAKKQTRVAKPQATPAGAKAPATPTPTPPPTQPTQTKGKSGLTSLNKKRLAVGAAGVGGGMYLASQPSGNESNYAGYPQ